MLPFIFSLIAALLVSLISLISVFFIFIKTPILKKLTLFFVSFAIGGLLGDAFIHLLPQSFEKLGANLGTSFLIIVGILIFFIIEKVLRWRHCHDIDCSHDHLDGQNKSIITLSLVGDTVHNMIDGMIITASFMVSIPVGITTTLAVILHEIPQEIGHFGIFIHNGLSIFKAVTYNLFSALASIIGVILTIFLGSHVANFYLYLIPITAGGFIYLASSDLIPELHRHKTKISHSGIQLFFILLGVALMSLLVFVE
ncbi:MAG: ZIP family metal transporter [Candidatus Shapirobacteria bacterium]